MARKANGAAIKALREAVGITQKTLASRADISREAISQVENGKQGLHPHKLKLVAIGLGVPVDAITTYEPEPDGVAS